MKYQAIFERAPDGTIWGLTPEFPGAFGSGETIDEARESLREGVRLLIETTKENGGAISPQETIAIETLEV